MAKPAHTDDIRAGKPIAITILSRVCLCWRMMRRSLVAMLQFTDDALLHRQPTVDHVEFDPTLEGEAVDKLLMGNTWA